MFERDGLGEAAAAWAQAFGSILAIASAIWISDRENRERRREALRVRKRAVSAIRFGLSSAANEAATIYHDLLGSNGLGSKSQWRGWRLQCENSLALLRYAESLPDQLHPSFLQEASNGRLLLRELLEILKEIESGSGDLQSEISHVETCAANLAFLRSRLDERLGVFEAQNGSDAMV